ncbi:MAG: hypothetical protein JZU52_12695 [Lamprocystis purpurea]|jgi:hypothetical protein|uniref:hypothetical protein n=1 Tax=Lamprocystis purpurea TaxID=61598 RepID=UPI0003736BD7|nr:hypothetical protein [Lamprocystis purpurea]MBV5274454.1 hypothetical protein [Lamprocystis purpurea]
MAQVRIPLPTGWSADLGPARLSVRLVDASGAQVLGFAGTGLRTEYADLAMSAEVVLDLTPTAQLALPDGAPTWYALTLATRAVATRYRIQVADVPQVQELRDLVGAAGIDPAELLGPWRAQTIALAIALG